MRDEYILLDLIVSLFIQRHWFNFSVKSWKRKWLAMIYGWLQIQWISCYFVRRIARLKLYHSFLATVPIVKCNAGIRICYCQQQIYRYRKEAVGTVGEDKLPWNSDFSKYIAFLMTWQNNSAKQVHSELFLEENIWGSKGKPPTCSTFRSMASFRCKHLLKPGMITSMQFSVQGSRLMTFFYLTRSHGSSL